MTTLKASNPKDIIGSDKLPLHLWPETATILGSLGLLDGLLKYGRGNFREIGVRSSIYYDAARRHLNAWFEGEDADPDSGLPHLGHALACIAILIDAGAAGKLNDDRQYPGGYRKLVTEMTPHVARLKEMHKDKAPKHYTIADAPEVCAPETAAEHANKQPASDAKESREVAGFIPYTPGPNGKVWILWNVALAHRLTKLTHYGYNKAADSYLFDPADLHKRAA